MMRFLTGFLLLALAFPALADRKFSPLAHAPDWSKLDGYQRTITRAEFTRLINSVYAIDPTVIDLHGPPSFWAYTRIDDDKVTLYSDATKKTAEFTLHFAPSDAACKPRPYFFHTHGISNDPQEPLKGLTIALDPGHIGGDWAKLEARYFKLGDDPPVMEGKLNMITCQILANRLQGDGAKIVWAKHGYEPTTDERPDMLHHEAIAELTQAKSAPSDAEVFGVRVHKNRLGYNSPPKQSTIDNEAALLFYRVAEIRARAAIVNQAHPDLTICVHYNADDWGDYPDRPQLTAHSRLIIFVNGSYERSELVYDDVRYDMLRKLLDRDAAQEERGCALVGRQMLQALQYPPDDFSTSFSHRITDVPSVYTRNLLANRLYHGPVIYCEGPYMNARDAYYRIIAGDYIGKRTIQGRSVPSIYREYALAVERGVLEYFAK